MQINWTVIGNKGDISTVPQFDLKYCHNRISTMDSYDARDAGRSIRKMLKRDRPDLVEYYMDQLVASGKFHRVH